MTSITRHIPNTITCLNLFSGILGVFAAYNEDYRLSMAFVFASALFDFLDGFAARLLKAYSPMGKELDSLADMVSFGLLPGVIAFRLMQPAAEEWFAAAPYFGLLVTVFSALRLARFNIDDRQATSFLGLAVPANALFWVGLACSFESLMTEYFWAVPLIVAVSCFLLVAPIPMFSLKIKSLRWSANRSRYIFLIGAVLLVVLFGFDALAFIILWYILVSVIGDTVPAKGR